MKKDGLLQKKYKSMNKAERESLKIAIGVSGRPYPVYETRLTVNQKGEHVAVEELRVMEDDSNPIYIYSERPYDEVMGILYRYMPSPSMSEIFLQGLQLRRPESKRRIQYIKGEPGAGKSFMGKLHGSLRSKRGALVVDCGGKNLSELLYETVLDFENDRTFFSELDKRLSQDRLNPTSISILKKAINPAALIEDENGRLAIDWTRLGNAETVDGQPENYMDIVRKALTDVSRLEGLDQFGGNALGLIMREGPLITAFKEGREIILDEYNKSKEGTDDSLQTVLQFLAGEIDECPAENRLKTKGDESTNSFTFRRSDMKPGFFVTATGNAVEDGITTRPLSKSANSRLQPVMLPKATELDWQHRWCQILMDVPLSTLYYTAKRDWDGDKKGFRKFLRDRLTSGRTAEEISNIPEEHFALANNWERVFEATKNLARFCERTANLLDLDQGDFNAEGFDEILAEIEDGEFTDEVSFDFRKIIKYVEQARDHAPRSKARHLSRGFDRGDWKEQKTLSPRQKEPVMLNFGTRLVDEITKDILNISHKRGKKATFKQLLTWQINFNLIGTDLTEGQKKDGRLVSDLLNISPYEGHDLEANAEIAQRLMAEFMRERFPEIKGAADEILSMKSLFAAMQRLEDISWNDLLDEHQVAFKNEFNNASGITHLGNGFILLNQDKKTAGRTPFLVTSTYDTTPFQAEGGVVQPKFPDDASMLAGEEDVLQTLIIPIIGRKNLQSMWTDRINNSRLTGSSEESDAIAIAQGRHKSGLALTTIHVNANGQKKPVHVIHNAKTGKTLIVGNGINNALKERFAHCKIEYLDRNEAATRQNLRDALVDVADQYAGKLDAALKMAFLMRNQSKLDSNGDVNRPLAELLLAEDVEPFIEHLISRRTAPLKLKIA